MSFNSALGVVACGATARSTCVPPPASILPRRSAGVPAGGWHALLAALLLAAVAARGDGEATAPPAATDGVAELAAIDRPNDAGRRLLLSWRKSAEEGPRLFYAVWMAEAREGPFRQQALVRSIDCALQSSFPSAFGLGRKTGDYRAFEVAHYRCPDPAAPDKSVGQPIRDGQRYFFKVSMLRDGLTVGESPVVAAVSAGNWLARDRLNVLTAMLLIGFLVLYNVRRAKRKPESIYLRRIPGLEAIEEAIGRAAEMGKPIYFCHGLGDVALVVTVASVNLLGKVAEQAAQFGAELKVTCFDYMVQQVSQEMVKDACLRVGRPDAYRADNVFFVADQSFAYATAVEGMLLRERPATCLFFGQFMSEALLLSETGAVTRAIQIAGTDNWTQIPFFITTCDYTLIGEELYAASAFLSREPRLLGTVKGQDAVKFTIMVAIIVGTLLAPCGVEWFRHLFVVLR